MSSSSCRADAACADPPSFTGGNATTTSNPAVPGPCPITRDSNRAECAGSLGSITGKFSYAPTDALGCESARARPLRRKLNSLLSKWQRSGSASKRNCGCGRRRIAEEVLVKADGQGHAHFQGIMRCNSAWECPVCGSRKRGTDAELLMRVIDRWRRERKGGVYLATFTVAHAMGDDLKTLAQGMTTAFGKLFAGRAGLDFRSNVGGGLHAVRSLEVTHGQNGWHPHIHVLFATERVMNEDEVLRTASWLYERWADIVVRELGEQHAPLPDVGTDFRVAHKAEYLAKLGLEISDPGVKQGKNGSRTPLQILQDWVDGGQDRDKWLYQTYAQAMKGRKFLTWSSKGVFADLKRAVMAELATEAAEEPERLPVAVIDGPDWDHLRETEDAPTTLLEAAERTGTAGVFEQVLLLAGDGARTRSQMLTLQFWRCAHEANNNHSPPIGAPPPQPPPAPPDQVPLPLPVAPRRGLPR